MLEATIEGTACEDAEKRGWYHRKLVWLGRRGGPDQFFAKKGRIVLAEFKKSGKKPDRKQAKEHDRLRRQGVECYVIDSIEQAAEIFT